MAAIGAFTLLNVMAFITQQGIGLELSSLLLLIVIMSLIVLVRLQHHAREFEKHLGVKIIKEITSMEEHADSQLFSLKHIWTYLIDYYPIANDSYRKFHHIKESA